MFAGRGHRGLDLGANLRRYPFVGIDGKHPIAPNEIKRPVLLGAVPGPIRRLRNLVGEFAADVPCSIGTAAVDHDNFAGPCDGIEAAAYSGLIVAGDNDDGNAHIEWRSPVSEA